jgi:predicted metal-dependent phosphotriesterase family hydrolase
MEEYLQYLLGHGVTEEELNLMTKVNPAQLINLL